jgi:hypothetical protein
MKAQPQLAGDASFQAGAPAPLAPLLAGARARGMADAFALLGVAAAFIDEGGLALHVNDHARRVLGPQLWLDDGRLRAADVDLDEALNAAIESTLSDRAPTGAATEISFASDSRGAVAVKVMAIPSEARDPYQLLRAVVIIQKLGSAPAFDKARLAGMN